MSIHSDRRWADNQYRPPSLSSSPDYSDRHLSSPGPSSPIYSFPRIHLTPNSPSLTEDDYHLSWDPPVDSKVTYSLPSFRSLFASDDEHPLSSEYDASEYSEPEATHDDSYLTESEDEEQDPFFSDARVTFSVSAERGRWKSDPLPRHAFLRISARTTSPAPSPAPSAILRNISEPAPSTKNPTSDVDETFDRPLSSPPPAHESPVLSPISLSVSPMIGSVSPLSDLEHSSPLSLPPPSLAGDHDMDLDLDFFPDNDEITDPVETGLGLLDSPPVPSNPSRPSSPSPSPHVIDIMTPEASIEPIEALSSLSPAPTEDHVVPDSAMDVDPIVPKKTKASSKLKSHPDPLPAKSLRSEAKHTTAPPQQESIPPAKKGAKQEQGDKGKKRASQQPVPEEGPRPKKARITHAEPEASGSRPRTKRAQQKGKTTDVEPKGKKTRAAARDPPQKAKKRKARPRSPSLSSSSRSSSPASEERPHKPAPEIDSELCGMLIECMATSRASSLPMSTLYKTVMQSYPSLKSRGTEDECFELMERVLEGGTVTAGGTGVFGKVQSNGKDDMDPPLEAQWFYVPERDHDQERAQLIRSMMPRPAKRSETKKYKQYYYRPLEKISRWDPEDEL